MWKTGLTSISFRGLKAEEIIGLCVKAGVDGIEWGGDGHVLPGQPERAAEVAKMTREAGLEVLSLGSYYYPGAEADSVGEQVLELARVMDTKTVRVWAGRLGSLDAEGEPRKRVVAALKSLCRKAAAEDITVCTEYHARTLTDNCPSALRMLQEVGEPNLRTYWQPVVYDSADMNARVLQALLPKTESIHVFAWTLKEDCSIERQLLSQGEAAWKRYLEVLKRYDGDAPQRDRSFMVEFVRGDEPESFLRDAETLNRWIRG